MRHVGKSFYTQRVHVIIFQIVEEDRQVRYGLSYLTIAILADDRNLLSTHMTVMTYLLHKSKRHLAVLTLCSCFIYQFSHFRSMLRLVAMLFGVVVKFNALSLQIFAECLNTPFSFIKLDRLRWIVEVFVGHNVGSNSAWLVTLKN